ncbi:sodium channel protein Nach [Mycetomoellerius zeteki]|uniref:sodium channel protein Nach n=1 Tax=Mycetomoellerius zeteki TaxID=64791 RepID=UPI00084EBCDF|nr:PREDICTED: sodium channel protein Nach-like [Trachymyrmex zeteki]
MWVERNKVKAKNNTFIKQAWMTKVSEKSSRLKTILKYLKLYCKHSSINSLKYLVDSQRPWFERITWVIIHCIIISVLVSMVYTSYQEFVSSPIVISMDAHDHKTATLAFPGISICSINRISLQSAKKLATNISNAKITDQSVDEILDLIKQLGNLYVSVMVNNNSQDVKLDKLLTTYYNGSYDITEIMKTLTPQCSMLMKCKLHGIYRNCSELFEFRKTQDGYCCTFNYVRESDDIPKLNNIIEPRDQESVKTLGIIGGLSVMMDPLLDDYFYSILPVKGWKVVVFNPTDYPDMTSGGVTEVLAMPQYETYLNVEATLFSSSRNIINLPRNKRNCVFSSEIIFSNITIYTYSDCIVNCKINDIQKYCGCRPFIYPRRGKEDHSWRICNITDFQCLSKYKSKRMTIFSHEDVESSLFQEENDALHCIYCYPACNDTRYSVLSMRAFMDHGTFEPNIFPNYKITNEGLLHVYFSKHRTIKLRQDMSSYWYNLLSDIGSICGVFIGFSFIAIVELLYFFVLLFCDLFCKKSVLQKDDRKTEIPPDQIQTKGKLYWNELLPRSWHSAKYGKFFTKKARY